MSFRHYVSEGGSSFSFELQVRRCETRSNRDASKLYCFRWQIDDNCEINLENQVFRLKIDRMKKKSRRRTKERRRGLILNFNYAIRYFIIFSLPQKKNLSLELISRSRIINYISDLVQFPTVLRIIVRSKLN